MSDLPNTEFSNQVGADGLPSSPIQSDSKHNVNLEGNVEITEDGLPTQIEDGPEDFDKEEAEKPEKPTTRRFATILNLLNTLLGAGILSVPNSFNHLGIIPSSFLLLFIGILSHAATVLTIKLKARTNADGLDDLALRVTGKIGSVCLSVLTLIFLEAAMISFLIINAGTISSWFEPAGIDILGNKIYRALAIVIYAICIPIPMTIPRQIGFLKYCSFVSFGAIILFVIGMIIKACQILPYPEGEGPEIILGQWGMGIFSAISIYGLTFSLPIVVLPIIEPYNPDLKKRSKVSLIAVIICYIAIEIPAVIGYMLFGKDTKSIVLENFASDDVVMIIVKIGFFFCVSFSYPAVAQSVMASWSQLLYKTNLQGELPAMKRLVIIIITNIIPIVIAVFLPDARPILSIGGAFGGCIVDFVYPALMWILISKKKWYHWQNLLCGLLGIFGLVSAVISTYQAVVDAIDAFKK